MTDDVINMQLNYGEYKYLKVITYLGYCIYNEIMAN